MYWEYEMLCYTCTAIGNCCMGYAGYYKARFTLPILEYIVQTHWYRVYTTHMHVDLIFSQWNDVI